MQNALRSTYLFMGYWPIHHGEPNLAKRQNIYNLTMKEIACDKMYKETLSHVPRQKVHDPNFEMVCSSPV
jgi:hypothetical protein